MSILGTAYVEVLPETGGFAKKMLGEIKSSLGGAGPAVAGIAAAGIGVGVALFEIGEKFEGLRNKIITTTGASGKALDGLDTSAKHVLATTLGATFANVGDTIGQLAQRTGLTGVALEDLARKQIELGKITKTDVGANVQATTALFTKFGISAKDQSRNLDVLFEAVRRGGKGVDTLVSDLTRSEPALAGLGLSFGQQASLISGLERSGVNAQRVVMGLSKEFKTAATEGKSPIAVISDLVSRIQGATSPTEKMTIAVQALGARAGGEFVAAVNSGALSLKNLHGTLGGMNIDQTAKATATLGDKFKVFKNEALVAIAPLAAKFLGFLNYLIDHKPILIGVLAAITVGVVALGVAMAATAIAGAPIEALFALLVVPIAAVVVGIIYAYNHFKVFHDIVNGVVTFIRTRLIPIFEAIPAAIAAVIRWFERLPDTVRNVVGHVVDFFKALPGKIVDALANLGSSLIGALHDAFFGLIDALPNMAEGLIRFFFELPFKILALYVKADVWLVDTGVKILKGLLDGVVSVLKDLWKFFTDTLPKKILEAVKDIGHWLFGGPAHDLIWGLIHGAENVIGDVFDWFIKLPGKIIAALGDVTKWLHDVGKNLIKGLIKGVKDGVGGVASAIKDGIMSGVKDLGHVFGLSPSPFFVGLGKNMMDGLVLGISDNKASVHAALANLNLGLPTLNLAGSGGVSGGIGLAGPTGTKLDAIAAHLANMNRHLEARQPLVVHQTFPNGEPKKMMSDATRLLAAAGYRAGR